MDWIRWPNFAKLWAQIVRWTMRQEAPANFEVYTKIEGAQGRVVVEALDKDASYLNFLNLPVSDDKALYRRYLARQSIRRRRPSTSRTGRPRALLPGRGEEARSPGPSAHPSRSRDLVPRRRVHQAEIGLSRAIGDRGA